MFNRTDPSPLVRILWRAEYGFVWISRALSHLKNVSRLRPLWVDGLVDGGEEQGDEDEEPEEHAQDAKDELERAAAADATVGKRFGALVQVVAGALKYAELPFKSFDLEFKKHLKGPVACPIVERLMECQQVARMQAVQCFILEKGWNLCRYLIRHKMFYSVF